MVVPPAEETSEPSTRTVWVGIDIGGTFTDFVVYSPFDQVLSRYKVLSTPTDPADAVLQGLSQLPRHVSRRIVHGSTVATNAILERKGARTALITTEGFRDILHIGRQDRPDLYALIPQVPPSLIPRDWCMELRERLDCHGTVVTPLQTEAIPSLVTQLRAHAIQSVAVSFLFSFLNATHEQQVAKALRAEGWFVTASAELLPEFREYERTSTTVVNAYVSPVLNQYLGRLDQTLAPAEFHILQSNGGRISVEQARGQGVRSILSGPAGGVLGAKYCAGLAGFHQILTFDMGGTSTDVCLVDDDIPVTTTADVDGWPIRVPVIDLHTVGSGGGSLARVDAGGNLRVGPQSAGADPGPVCYGRGGTIPTVTDAHVVLGRLPGEKFLGGTMPLQSASAGYACEALSQSLALSPLPGLDPAQTVALGIVQIANAHMERALRVISIERGKDPRDTVLVSFGGAGGLHACDLARALEVPRVLISPMAATLSALGMLVADVQLDYVQTVMLGNETPFATLAEKLAELVHQGEGDLKREGIPPELAVITRSLDVRYVGQSFELDIPLTPDFRAAFDDLHHERYGYSQPESPIEIVNVRARAIGRVTPPPMHPQPLGPSDASSARDAERPVVLARGIHPVPHYHGHLLRPGHEIPGPAILVLDDSTVFLDVDDRARIDGLSNILIDVGADRG